MIKISVVIASYNPNLIFLRKAIESVLNQTIKDLEIIIIDDCSVLGIKESLTAFWKCDNILIHRNDRNIERSASRNKWVNLAKWEYIAFLDDDDVWIDKLKLEKQINFLENNLDYGLCGTNGIYIDKDDNKIGDYDIQVFSDKDIRSKILLYNPFILSSILVKKKIFLDIWGFNEKMNMSEDFDLYLRAGNVCRFSILEKMVIWYRIANNSSLKNQLKIKLIYLQLNLKYWQFYPNRWKTFIILLLIFVFPYKIIQKINSFFPKKLKDLLYK